MSDAPFVAIGAGESAPWAHLPLTCPECGAGPIPLQDSDPPGVTFIKCPEGCGTWLRGEPDFEKFLNL